MAIAAALKPQKSSCTSIRQHVLWNPIILATDMRFNGFRSSSIVGRTGMPRPDIGSARGDFVKTLKNPITIQPEKSLQRHGRVSLPYKRDQWYHYNPICFQEDPPALILLASSSRA